jgi:hypothetical protein
MKQERIVVTEGAGLQNNSEKEKYSRLMEC